MNTDTNSTRTKIGPGVLFGAGIEISAAREDAFDWRRKRLFKCMWIAAAGIALPAIVSIALNLFGVVTPMGVVYFRPVLFVAGLAAMITGMVMLRNGPNLSSASISEENGKFKLRYSFWGLFGRITRERLFDTEAAAQYFLGD